MAAILNLCKLGTYPPLSTTSIFVNFSHFDKETIPSQMQVKSFLLQFILGWPTFFHILTGLQGIYSYIKPF